MEATALPQDLLSLSAAVLLLGLRHGVDADHLATIDALTRHRLQRGDAGARWIGAMFSLGHGAVVIVTALAVAQLARQWQVPAWLDAFGAWTSIGILLMLALLNASSLRKGARHVHAAPVGLRTRWLSGALGAGPLAAAGVGALFALSFDTLSIAALMSVSASQHAGWLGALQCALLFTGGMLVTDALNGLWVARLLRRSERSAAAAARWMGWAVVAVSLFSAALALAAQLGVGALIMPPLWPCAIIFGAFFVAFVLGR